MGTKFILTTFTFLLLSMPVMAFEKAIQLAKDVSLAAESIDDVQIDKLNVDQGTASFWLHTGQLQNQIDEFENSEFLVECEYLSLLLRTKVGYKQNSNSKLVLVIGEKEMDSLFNETTIQSGKNPLNLTLKEDTEIEIEGFGKVFQGQTEDGRDVYGIVSDNYGEYKVEHGDGDASGKVSKKGTMEFTRNLYARGEVDAGAVIFYDKLIPGEKETITEKLDEINISELINSKLGAEVGVGAKKNAFKGEVSVEVYTRYESSEKDLFDLKREYEVIRGQYDHKLSEKLALVSGITAKNHSEIGKVYSAFSGFETKGHKFEVEINNRSFINNIESGPSITSEYEQKLDENLEVGLSSTLPLQNDDELVVSFTIKRKF